MMTKMMEVAVAARRAMSVQTQRMAKIRKLMQKIGEQKRMDAICRTLRLRNTEDA
jgi:hypothetical protein